MIAVSQTKSANYLFIVAVLKSMRDGGVITPAEYERAKLPNTSEPSATTRNSPAPTLSLRISHYNSIV